ncbi:ATP-dependent DNA helicase [Halotalea alkalilenta]|uniref:ATP-dependent DNA helicase n=1 Tax=Halotalea alkalilenta TaxID=376489 RepID=A0A172YBH8_9GAMM|nr:ATP-dependent DNA helicase [Halotalea alkalilenta]ANF56577.1 ATP-dependent DNA helicase [Halotalea alkalilenta]
MSYTVAVRALCEFVAKRGDLDLRFTPSPSALEGIEGHAKVAARRGEGYQRELSLEGEYRELKVRGRADGFDATVPRLEEIKTHRGELERQPDNHRQLHWAQAKIYGWLACQRFALKEIELALVYFDIDRERETVIRARHDRKALERFFTETCEAFLSWAQQEAQHALQRERALASMKFPMADFRPGQRALAETVYKAARLERPLLLQAPTGIGKTLGTLFPLLKALPAGKLDKVFFLTAKTPGRQLALDALARLDPGLDTPLRALELIAREKSCEHPDKACHGESCPLAAGFYDRLPAARAKALEQVARERSLLDAETLRRLALAEGICPYYLGQEMARWSDVVVGDYNHYFGLGGMLHALAQEQRWRVGVLVDEAHNLVERGRLMFSAELDERSVRELARSAPKGLRRGFERLARAFRTQRQALAPSAGEAPLEGVLEEVPSTLVGELTGLTARLGEHLATQLDEPVDPELMRFYLQALGFARVLELFDARHFQCEFERLPGKPRETLLLRLRNLVPGPWLAPRFEAARACVLFSATLAPTDYFIDLLGLPAQTAWFDVASPFAAAQLRVRAVSRISTRYRDREASIEPIVELIEAGYAACPGNYLAFFSSFDYLERVAERLAQKAPGLVQWRQSRRMGEEQRRAFLERFAPGGQGIGFAVLGGAFGEGVDLPGDRLVGAFIATLGLPQFNAVNQALRQRLGALFGESRGYRYAYLYPGLTKVIQAAGRVIRDEDDRGALWLIDDRFDTAEVRGMLPPWWEIERA